MPQYESKEDHRVSQRGDVQAWVRGTQVQHLTRITDTLATTTRSCKLKRPKAVWESELYGQNRNPICQDRNLDNITNVNMRYE